MTKREIFVVALKIFGIYLLVRAVDLVQTLGWAVGSLSGRNQTVWLFIGSLIAFLFHIGGSFCLIKWAEPIAGKLAGKEEGPEVKGALEKDALQAIAFSAVGVFIVAAALPRLTSMVATLTLQWSHQARLRTWGAIVGIVLQLGIGTFLFFGSKGVVALLKRIKSL